ncbi:hypothetical protein, partial [Halorubrum sp. Atlit-26R]|uniref:hypothetical protein n=1 Tax=Halorubrum sp. Atlit-26R TaxID=2282128 RepID=UPI000F25075F
EAFNDSVSVGPGNATTVEFDVPVPVDASLGPAFVEVETDDDDAATRVDVEEQPAPANFTLEVDEAASLLEVTNGSTARVAVEIDNVGDLAGNTSVNATTDAGGPVNVTTDELAGGESTTEIVRIPVDPAGLGDSSESFQVNLTTLNDSATTDVTVNPRPDEA